MAGREADRSRTLTVLKLITSSNSLDCSIGKSTRHPVRPVPLLVYDHNTAPHVGARPPARQPRLDGDPAVLSDQHVFVKPESDIGTRGWVTATFHPRHVPISARSNKIARRLHVRRLRNHCRKL